MVEAATRKSRPRRPGAASKHSGEPCRACGDVHTGCTGHTKNGTNAGRPCKRKPGKGSDVCEVHGNSGRTAELALKRYQFASVEGEVAALLREADLPQQHPLDGLLEVVRHSGAMMRMLSLEVGKLEREGVVGGESNEAGVWTFWMKNESLYGVDHTGDQAAHVLVSLYEKWSALHMRACKTALDANIDERLVRNAEATSEKFFQAFAKAVDNAKLTPDQSAALRNTLATELRKLSPIDARMVEDGD